MEVTALKYRITQGENTTTEFKESFDQEVIETAAAFADTDGGTVLYEFHPLETKIIFDSPIQETTFIEIDDISEQLNERQKNAFFYVQRRGEIKKREYMEINHVSHRIAYEELKDMTGKGLLTMVGKGRGTKYVRKVTD